ncbi:MAG: hypothetical protein KatS3mg056_1533 [Chloroflexus sp.]|nr:MAG: hypothetical protein KatS3mg056_1533 [Chloroflexus sp.]
MPVLLVCITQVATCVVTRPRGLTARMDSTTLEPVSKNIYYEGISFIADRFHDRDEHTRHLRDQPDQRCDTCQIVSTAGAAAWLPHSKRRHTRMTSGQGNQCSA